MTSKPKHDAVAEEKRSTEASSSVLGETPLAIFAPVVALAGTFSTAALGNPGVGKLVAVALLALGCLFALYFIIKREKKISDALLLVAVPFVCAAFSWNIPKPSATVKVPAEELGSSRPQKIGRLNDNQAPERFLLGVRTVELSAASEGDFPDLVGNERYGLKVETVDKGSPGSKADLRVNDVIQQASGREIKTRMDLDAVLQQFCPNLGPVTLGVWRNGRTVNLAPICPSL